MNQFVVNDGDSSTLLNFIVFLRSKISSTASLRLSNMSVNKLFKKAYLHTPVARRGGVWAVHQHSPFNPDLSNPFQFFAVAIHPFHVYFEFPT